MPVLKNPKHEAFAQGVFSGQSYRESYIAAGYAAKPSTADAAASRLMKDVKSGVADRVAELQAQAVARVSVATAETVEKITGELQAAFDLAKEQKQPNYMVLAATAKAKLNGLIVEKSEATILHKHEDRVKRREEILARRREERAADGAGARMH